MRKLAILIILLILSIASPSYALIHAYKGLTGGASANLDGIPVASISDGEIAVGSDTSNIWRNYHYDSSNNNTTNPESSPDVIVPDDNGTGTGAWILDGGKREICIVINSPATSSDTLIARNSTGGIITFTAVYGILHSGTNVIGQFYICQSGDINDPMDIEGDCNPVDSSDITFDGLVDFDTSLNGDVTWADGEWLAFGVTSISSPGKLTVCITE